MQDPDLHLTFNRFSAVLKNHPEKRSIDVFGNTSPEYFTSRSTKCKLGAIQLALIVCWIMLEYVTNDPAAHVLSLIMVSQIRKRRLLISRALSLSGETHPQIPCSTFWSANSLGEWGLALFRELIRAISKDNLASDSPYFAHYLVCLTH